MELGIVGRIMGERDVCCLREGEGSYLDHGLLQSIIFAEYKLQYLLQIFFSI